MKKDISRIARCVIFAPCPRSSQTKTVAGSIELTDSNNALFIKLSVLFLFVWYYKPSSFIQQILVGCLCMSHSDKVGLILCTF